MDRSRDRPAVGRLVGWHADRRTRAAAASARTHRRQPAARRDRRRQVHAADVGAVVPACPGPCLVASPGPGNSGDRSNLTRAAAICSGVDIDTRAQPGRPARRQRRRDRAVPGARGRADQARRHHARRQDSRRGRRAGRVLRPVPELGPPVGPGQRPGLRARQRAQRLPGRAAAADQARSQGSLGRRRRGDGRVSRVGGAARRGAPRGARGGAQAAGPAARGAGAPVLPRRVRGRDRRAMGISRGTVKSSTSRALAALGRMLKEES